MYSSWFAFYTASRVSYRLYVFVCFGACRVLFGPLHTCFVCICMYVYVYICIYTCIYTYKSNRKKNTNYLDISACALTGTSRSAKWFTRRTPLPTFKVYTTHTHTHIHIHIHGVYNTHIQGVYNTHTHTHTHMHTHMHTQRHRHRRTHSRWARTTTSTNKQHSLIFRHIHAYFIHIHIHIHIHMHLSIYLSICTHTLQNLPSDHLAHTPALSLCSTRASGHIICA